MKPIELRLKTHSRTWLTPVLLIFIAFFAMAMASPIYAAPPDPCLTDFCDQDADGYIRDHRKCPNFCDKAADPDDNDCSIPVSDGCGGSSGDYIRHNYANRMIWGNDGYFALPYELDEEDNQKMRLCGPGSREPIIPPHPRVAIGYVCHSNANFLYGREYWNTVYLDLSALSQGPGPGLEATGRDPGLCERLLQPFEAGETGLAVIPKKEKEQPEGLGCTNPPDPYCDDNEPPNVGRLSMYYFGLDDSNDEPCTWNSNPENSCHVTIFTQGYFYNECNESGTKCGRRIGLEAYGHVLHAPKPADGEPTEINPFTQDQFIVIEELNGFFMGIGTNRKEADCYLNNVNDGVGYHYENLVFRTCVDANENGVCDSEESQQ